jgi:hypothetical protein
MTRTGNSLGLRFDRALFQSHPEFSGEVRAYVIAPGRMLVVAEQPVDPREEEDPVMKAFLSILEQDMVKSPRRVKPLKQKLAARVKAAVGYLPVDPEEEIDEEYFL